MVKDYMLRSHITSTHYILYLYAPYTRIIFLIVVEPDWTDVWSLA